jgi:prephenate dehydrogenase
LEPAPFERVGIVGLGLIGGSLALSVREAWPHVRIAGVDRPDVLAAARRLELIDDARSEIGKLADADLVVLAAPVPQIVELIAAAAQLRLPALVTDVGSTKRRIMQAADDAGLPDFIGGHPIAGSERGGLEHARKKLFAGRPWLLVPGRAAADRVRRLERFVSGLGAVPRRIDAERHDRTMAYVSHVPQLVAVALMNGAGDAVGDEGLAAAGRAFADMTRLATSPPELWQGILESNADFVEEALGRLAAALEAARPVSGGARRLVQEFTRASQRRDRLPKNAATGEN